MLQKFGVIHNWHHSSLQMEQEMKPLVDSLVCVLLTEVYDT